jgi:hypothetical protein
VCVCVIPTSPPAIHHTHPIKSPPPPCSLYEQSEAETAELPRHEEQLYEYIVTTREQGLVRTRETAVLSRQENKRTARTRGLFVLCTVRTSEQRHFQEKSTSLTSSIFNKLNRANTHVSKTFLRVKEPCLHISLCFFPCLGTG